jgi:hypothetical protein
MWVDQVDEFHHIFCYRISHPPTQMELKIHQTIIKDELILCISFHYFYFWGFIDATDFRTTRTGSGPQPDSSRRAYAYNDNGLSNHIYCSY